MVSDDWIRHCNIYPPSFPKYITNTSFYTNTSVDTQYRYNINFIVTKPYRYSFLWTINADTCSANSYSMSITLFKIKLSFMFVFFFLIYELIVHQLTFYLAYENSLSAWYGSNY